MAKAAIAHSRPSSHRPARTSGKTPRQSDIPTQTPAERVTAQISAMLERGVRPWIKPWDDITPSNALVLPLRSCGTPYRGMNVVALWAATLESGFKARHWFTFKQALALNAAVRKGERGSYVVFYTELNGKAGETTTPNTNETSEARRILRGYTVFNADQIEGLPDSFYPKVDCEPSILSPVQKSQDEARISALFAKIPVTIRHGGNRAFYSKANDIIQMPVREAFRDGSLYFSTVAHEASHATRHPSRLNRDFGQTRFGDPAYALEELVAELASAFIGAHIGLPADHLEDHAAYIGGWLKALSDNPSAFLTAASKALAAADWVLREMGVV